MFSDALFNNFGDVFQTRGQLFLLVVAQSDVVCDLAVISHCIHSVFELQSGLFELALLVQDTCLVDHNVGVLLIALSK